MIIGFEVVGIPAPQGSKIRTRWGMRESSDAVMPWREAVKAAVLIQRVAATRGPVHVDLVFRFQRPKAHYGTGRNVGVVKASAPPWPVSRRVGDIDKLARSTLDALTESGVITDDSHVVSMTANKDWVCDAADAGAYITIRELVSLQGETHE